MDRSRSSISNSGNDWEEMTLEFEKVKKKKSKRSPRSRSPDGKSKRRKGSNSEKYSTIQGNRYKDLQNYEKRYRSFIQDYLLKFNSPEKPEKSPAHEDAFDERKVAVEIVEENKEIFTSTREVEEERKSETPEKKNPDLDTRIRLMMEKCDTEANNKRSNSFPNLIQNFDDIMSSLTFSSAKKTVQEERFPDSPQGKPLSRTPSPFLSRKMYLDSFKKGKEILEKDKGDFKGRKPQSPSSFSSVEEVHKNFSRMQEDKNSSSPESGSLEERVSDRMSISSLSSATNIEYIYPEYYHGCYTQDQYYPQYSENFGIYSEMYPYNTYPEFLSSGSNFLNFPEFPGKVEKPVWNEEEFVEMAIERLISELKQVLSKDIYRKLVEGVAFQSFDKWNESRNMDYNRKNNNFKSSRPNLGHRGRFPVLKIRRIDSDVEEIIETKRAKGETFDETNLDSLEDGKHFPKRNEEKEKLILMRFLKRGIDVEDIEYVEKAYEIGSENSKEKFWKSCTWIDHPPTYSSGRKSENRTGSARTERIRGRRKKRKLKMNSEEGDGNRTPPRFRTVSQEDLQISPSGRKSQTILRDARINQRSLTTIVSDSDRKPELTILGNRLRLSASPIHGWGLFAKEPIPEGENVIEYVGQLIRPIVADVRERNYQSEGLRSTYFFAIDEDVVIDATRCGNLSRFINHSCDPNCCAKVCVLNGKKKIIIYAKRLVDRNEEITYDYKMKIENKKIRCYCGALNCRGTLN